MAQSINLGSSQAPYWEREVTIQAGEIWKLDYVTDTFNLLDISTPYGVIVSFGGSMIETPFTAGMGYKLNEPVQFIQLQNITAAPVTVRFAVGIGNIQDNRLNVSGRVFTQPAGGFKTYTATSTTGNSTTNYNDNSQIDVVCTAGTITVDNAAGVSGLVLTAGMAWSVFLADAGTLTISGTGSYNISVGNY